MNEFAITLNRMLKVSGKSLNEIAYLGKVDPAYARCLITGKKWNPSLETITKLWIGIIFDPEIVERYPYMIEGLAELLLAASMTTVALKNVESIR